jgi:hypothetical protein
VALDTFVAGRYSNTYNAVDVGISDQGINLQQESRWEEIASSDAYGDSIIDGVYRGGNVFFDYECKAYKAGSQTPFWPWGTLGVMQAVGSAPTPIGRLASGVASATVLTAVAGTPAATSPATLTASKSILAPNSPARLLFHTRLRQVPIRLLALPSDATNGGTTTTTWFTTT